MGPLCCCSGRSATSYLFRLSSSCGADAWEKLVGWRGLCRFVSVPSERVKGVRIQLYHFGIFVIIKFGGPLAIVAEQCLLCCAAEGRAKGGLRSALTIAARRAPRR